jgi:hypothetical protein
MKNENLHPTFCDPLIRGFLVTWLEHAVAHKQKIKKALNNSTILSL